MGAGLDVLKSAGKSIIGQTERAVITIYDIRPKSRTTELKTRKIAVKSASGALNAGLLPGGDLANSMAQVRNTSAVTGALNKVKAVEAMTDEAKKAILDKGGTLASLESEIDLYHADDIYDNIKTKKYSVQFNPTRIQIRAQGGGLVPRTDYQEGNSRVTFDSMETRIEVNIPLIFDKVSNKDAFMMEKFTLNPMEVAKGAATAVKLGTQGSDAFSVQPEVEAFIAAVRDVNLSYISFAWGDLFYAGLLNRVSSEYKMFDLQGRPVRAVVNLSLVCYSNDDNARKDWVKAYEDAYVNGNKKVKTNQETLDVLSKVF